MEISEVNPTILNSRLGRSSSQNKWWTERALNDCITGCVTVGPLQERHHKRRRVVCRCLSKREERSGGWGLQLLVCQLAVWLSICRFRLYTVLATKIGLRLCLRSAIRVNVSMIFLIIYCLFFFIFLYTTHRIAQEGEEGGGGVCSWCRLACGRQTSFWGTHKICITCSNNKVNCSKQCRQCKQC